MREKFGKLVLLEEIDVTGLGSEYRAAKLGPAGFEKLVSILRLKPAISSHPELARGLMDQAKLVAQLQNPNIVKILGIGKVEQTYYVSYEFHEGKTLKQIIDRSRTEGFPFAADHALLAASKVCSALEYCHSRRTEGGGRAFHGMVSPSRIVVSYEGEVKLKGFEYWPAGIRESLAQEDMHYLAPEQLAGAMGDGRCDVYSLGAVLFEALTGQEPGPELQSRVSGARLASPHGDDSALPRPLAEILLRSLAEDPGSRYVEIQEMRRALDTLLFSGDFTPTTFNLAFFMHSLYRDDIDREVKDVQEEREADYSEFLVETARPTRAPEAPAPQAPPAELVVPPAPTPAPAFEPYVVAPLVVPPPPPDLTGVAGYPAPESEPETEIVEPEPMSHSGRHARVAVPHPERTLSFGVPTKQASKAPIFLGLAAAVLIAVGVGAWFMLRKPAAPPAPTAPVLTAEEIAAQNRIKELESKLLSLEAERQVAIEKAQLEADEKLRKQATAKGQTVDAGERQRVRDEAARKAKEDEDKRQQEEIRKLEREKEKAAEDSRAATAKRAADDAARAEQERLAAAARAQATPTPTAVAEARPATPPPTAAQTPASAAPTAAAAPAVKPGSLVNIDDPGVNRPVPVSKPPLVYPQEASRLRQEGDVLLKILIDEKGNVSDVKVAQAASGFGLTNAAVDNARGRKYRPATKNGVPVKVWQEIVIRFQLKR